MSAKKYYDVKSMCPFGEYIENGYICTGCGESCKLGMFPNMYDCLDYNKYNKHKKKYENKTERSYQ